MNEELAKGKEIELKRAEEERVRVAILATAVDAMVDPVFVIDLEGRCVSANRACSKMFGLEPKDVVGKPFMEMPGIGKQKPGEIGKFMPLIGEAIERGRVDPVELILVAMDGREIPMSIACGVIKDTQGNPTYIVAVLRDITERKRAEEALQESENQYRTVFENTGTATVIIEEDTTISLANKEAVELSGYSKEELEGKSWTEFVAKEDLQRMIRYHKMRRSDPNSAPKNYECPFIDKMGNVKNTLLIIDVIPGTKKSVVSVLDITGRKKMEEERLKTAADKQRIEELEKFAKIAVGRELKMVELKERIKELESKLEEITGKE